MYVFVNYIFTSKDLLIDFLNQLLPPQHQIVQLNFKNPENLPETIDERRSIFDIYCESVTSERFIVEMQKANPRITFYINILLIDILLLTFHDSLISSLTKTFF